MGDRKYINTLAQFSLLRKNLLKNPELKLDLITAVTLKQKERYGEFTEIDRAVHNTDVAMIAQGITRINEILGNPEYRFKTYSLDTFDAGLNPVQLGKRMELAIQNIKNKLFFDYTLFMKDEHEPSPVGDPLIIVYGPTQVVSDLETSFGAQQSGQIFRTIFASRERPREAIPYSSLEPFRIEDPRSVFLIGVHPISEEWWMSKLKILNDELIRIISNCKIDKGSSSVCETIHTMANQSYQTYDRMIASVS